MLFPSPSVADSHPPRQALVGAASRDDYKFEEDDDVSGTITDDESEAGLSTLDVASSVDRPSGNVDLTAGLLNAHNRLLSSERAYGAESAPSDTGSDTSTESRARVRQRQQTQLRPLYTAYGPAGQVQRRAPSVSPNAGASGQSQRHAPAVESTAANRRTSGKTAAAATSSDVPLTRSGWTKIPSRKMALEAPDLLTRGRVDEDAEPKRYDFQRDDSDDEC